ncbi:dihydroneopterin aldolase [Fulvivirga lutea]|uniref:7,8-dihydroneopterin aldolase n=1 Tax=Fulvivirga lutea TaxID=2810512 RepID=A0A975A1E1_9BACT|nr:dihydroneopterin aldolase [Fulvivirga lutea]QSE97736.1 dihydroneopterin aldolase [Fulvivirga lutea]
MGKITLEGLAFYSYHGYHAVERENGNHFELNITVDTDFSDAAENDDLAKTVDYEKLYAIAKTEMANTSKLLEHVVNNIGKRILKEEGVNEVEVSLSKFNPPINGECKRATVSMKFRH